MSVGPNLNCGYAFSPGAGFQARFYDDLIECNESKFEKNSNYTKRAKTLNKMISFSYGNVNILIKQYFSQVSKLYPLCDKFIIC